MFSFSALLKVGNQTRPEVLQVPKFTSVKTLPKVPIR